MCLKPAENAFIFVTLHTLSSCPHSNQLFLSILLLSEKDVNLNCNKNIILFFLYIVVKLNKCPLVLKKLRHGHGNRQRMSASYLPIITHQLYLTFITNKSVYSRSLSRLCSFFKLSSSCVHAPHYFQTCEKH